MSKATKTSINCVLFISCFSVLVLFVVASWLLLHLIQFFWYHAEWLAESPSQKWHYYLYRMWRETLTNHSICLVLYLCLLQRCRVCRSSRHSSWQLLILVIALKWCLKPASVRALSPTSVTTCARRAGNAIPETLYCQLGFRHTVVYNALFVVWLVFPIVSLWVQ